MSQTNHHYIFAKSQIAAVLATAIDYLVLIGLVELAHVWYVFATAIAAMTGAVSNFLLGRYWSFNASNDLWHSQAIRYIFVTLGSLILNILGVFIFTEAFSIQYIISKTITALLVAVAFNYPLQRYYVFAGKIPQKV